MNRATRILNIGLKIRGDPTRVSKHSKGIIIHTHHCKSTVYDNIHQPWWWPESEPPVDKYKDSRKVYESDASWYNGYGEREIRHSGCLKVCFFLGNRESFGGVGESPASSGEVSGKFGLGRCRCVFVTFKTKVVFIFFCVKRNVYIYNYCKF